MTATEESSARTVERVSALLIDAHRHGRAIEQPPDGIVPLTREIVFAIQDRVALACGGVGGWKTGASSPDGEPNAAPLFTPLIGPSPALLPASRSRGVEAELAFRFARALPPRRRPYARDEVVAAIGTAHPTIEVVDSRLGAWAGRDALWKLADNQSNGYLVYGDPVPGWRDVDLARVAAELWIDDSLAVPAERSGNPAGDLLRLVCWLANHLAATRSGLRAGDIVTTGSFTGLLWVEPGQQVLARLAGVGEVAVQFAHQPSRPAATKPATAK